MRMGIWASRLVLAFAVSAVVAGCTVSELEQDYPEAPTNSGRERMERLESGGETIFGELVLGGPERPAEGGNGTNVNFYLWRAALETLSIGPLDSADPFGGVIITDWFTLEEDPGHQYRATAYIMGRELRTDNLRVALYLRPVGQDTAARRATEEAETRMENVILAKARDIRSGQAR